MKKRLIIIVLCLSLVLSAFGLQDIKVDAKATKSAMKYLKGTWIFQRHGVRSKIIFTRKYMKSYDLCKKNSNKLLSPKKKGRYLGKSKILSTKKKGKKWIIKIKQFGKKEYLISDGMELIPATRVNGKWEYNTYQAIQKYSKKVYK